MAQFLYTLTSSNINRFSKLFHYRIRRKLVIILSLKIPPHLKCVATLPCEMSSDEIRVLSGVVYKTKRRGPRTEPWEHHKSRYERKRNYFHI